MAGVRNQCTLGLSLINEAGTLGRENSHERRRFDSPSNPPTHRAGNRADGPSGAPLVSTLSL
jgi:hypothetical protein